MSNIIDIEDEEKEDIDLLHINTINKISNTDIDDTDIILTNVENEEKLDQQIFNDANNGADTSGTTPHRDGTYGSTYDGLNYNYDEVGELDVSEEGITNLVNIVSKLKFQGEENDETESVLSELPDDVFGNLNSFNYKTQTVEEINYDNNIKYDISKVGLGKSYISGASCYPPRLDTNSTLGAYHADLGTCTNVSIENRKINHDLNHCEIIEVEEDIQASEEPIFISNTNNKLVSNGISHSCVIQGINTIELVEDEVEHICVGNEVIINSKADRWHVHVPIKDGNGKVNWIYLFADPGANVGCVKSSCA